VRTIGVVTAARSDYGIYRPVLRALRQTPGLDLRLYVCGMHLSPEFGCTARDIAADGFDIAEQVDMLVASDEPAGTALSMGLGMCGFARILQKNRPDILVVLGDRFEMFTAAAAAVPFPVAVAHLHGGERTEGAIDERFRHAITKLSHLHFVAHEEYARRVVQLGEEPWRVTVSGAPGLDAIREMTAMLPERDAFLAEFGLPTGRPALLFTFHPVTTEHGGSLAQLDAVLSALDESGCAVLATCPNADSGGREMHARLRAHAEARPLWRLVDNLGQRNYYAAMAHCAAMVGNSSSGIIEAPSFGLPVVNIGSRQDGRLRAANVIDAAPEREPVLAAVRRALSPEFAAGCRASGNPFGDGFASGRIVDRLLRTPLDARLFRKKFHDIPAHCVPQGGL
jgi:UDP-hydrolysing UDP-N-acetyl-D-glucosamine 2-epimerase